MSVTRLRGLDGESVGHARMKLLSGIEGVSMAGKALDISPRARRGHGLLKDRSDDIWRVRIR